MICSNSIRPSAPLRAAIAEDIREGSSDLGAFIPRRFLTLQLNDTHSEWMEVGLGLTSMHAAIDVKRARIVEPDLPVAVIDCLTDDGALVDLDELPVL